MEKQALLPSPNDNGNIKQKKGYKPMLYVAVSTAILLLGLVFYGGGEYWGSPRALGVGTTDDDDLIPFGDECVPNDNDCQIPLGLTHGVCRNIQTYTDYKNYLCQSGQPGSSCGVTDDCVVPPGLGHAVCRKESCQSGKKGQYCGQDQDCISNNCVGVTGIAKCHN